jgi:hypothetical protein
MSFILQLVLFLIREYGGPGQSHRISGTFTLRYRILYIRLALQTQDSVTRTCLKPWSYIYNVFEHNNSVILGLLVRSFIYDSASYYHPCDYQALNRN